MVFSTPIVSRPAPRNLLGRFHVALGRLKVVPSFPSKLTSFSGGSAIAEFARPGLTFAGAVSNRGE